MELRVLHYFLAVAREQSISAAAKSLHLSQPTLSTQLRALEQELGKPLLVRGSKGSRKVTLTEEGMLLRKRAEEILELVRKTENEITLSDDAIAGDVYIGAGETRIMRLIARAACDLQKECPDIHCHISSGNARYVMEQLDKGLIDFGLLYAAVDPIRYNSIPIPLQDEWGVLMRRDAPLADHPFITPEDLMGQPLILSQQEETSHIISRWMNCDPARLNVAATYNLIFNASLLAEEGLGYTLSFDGLINTKDSPLCFRPLKPTLRAQACLVWKKYQIMPKAAEKFLHQLQEYLDEM